MEVKALSSKYAIDGGAGRYTKGPALQPMEAGEPRREPRISHLQFCSLVKVSSTDALANHVPVGAAGSQAHVLLHHDVLQLRSHLPHLEDKGQSRFSSVHGHAVPLGPAPTPTFRMALA